MADTLDPGHRDHRPRDRRGRDYSLVGPEAQTAAAVCLIDAEWFRPLVDPDRMRELTERTNGRAIADAILWLALQVESASVDISTVGAVRPDGSFDLGPLDHIPVGAIARVDVRDRTFAVARPSHDTVCVVDGTCTHGQVHLAGGAIVDGAHGPEVECPKHNGRFDLATGAPCRKPVSEPIAVYRPGIADGHVIADIDERTEQLTKRDMT